jgi:folate-dependent tRNA-U54 methylase TrmFO/GidA
MNVNFGLFPDFAPGTKVRGKDRKKAMSHRAIADLAAWLAPHKAAAE